MKVKELIELLHKLDNSGEKQVELCIDLDWTEETKSLESDMFRVDETYKIVSIYC